MTNFVEVEYDGQIAVVSLNRPEKRNAICRELTLELLDSLSSANSNSACHAIILKGNGQSFCAGDDLDELQNAEIELSSISESIRDLQEVTRQIMFNTKPVAAVVTGWAVGGGFSWVLNSDFIFWAEDARAFLPEAKYGLYPTGAATFLLPQAIGRFRASHLFHTGEKVSAEELLRQGMGTRLLPQEECLDAAKGFLSTLLSYPSEMPENYKAGLISPLREQIEGALEFEEQQCVRSVMALAKARGEAAASDGKLASAL